MRYKWLEDSIARKALFTSEDPYSRLVCSHNCTVCAKSSFTVANFTYHYVYSCTNCDAFYIIPK